MGLYKQPKSKNWFMEFTDEHGKRVRRSTRTADRTAAKIVLARELEAVESRKLGFAAPSPMAARVEIGAQIDRYLTQMHAEGLSESYTVRLRLRLNKMSRDLGWKTLRDIKRDELRAYLASELGDRTRATKKHYIDAMRQLCKWAINQSPPMLSVNPAEGVIEVLRGKRGRSAKISEYKRRPLTTEEAKRLLSSPPSNPLSLFMWLNERRPIYAVALRTGYRRSTLKQLRVQDVRLECANPRIVVPAYMTKSGRPLETPITDPTLLEMIEQRLRFCTAKRKRDMYYGRPLAPVPMIQTFRQDIARAGIPRVDEHGLEVVFHSLRMTFCTQLALSGVPETIGMKLMDHANIETTHKIYTHVGVTDSVPAMNALPSIGDLPHDGMAESMAAL
jgi:integrase